MAPPPPITRWTLVGRAQGDGPQAREALKELVQRYERTIDCHIRRRGYPPGLLVEDIRQEYLAAIFCREGDRTDAISHLDRKRYEKFRHWLRATVRNHVSRTWKVWKAKKLGNLVTDYPGEDVVADCSEGLGGTSSETPDELALRAEALDVFDFALRRHREQTKDKARFDQLQRFLAGRQFDDAERTAVAESLAVTSEHLNVLISNVNKVHRRVVCEVIADGLNLDPDTDPLTSPLVRRELKQLCAALAGGRTRPAPLRANFRL